MDKRRGQQADRTPGKHWNWVQFSCAFVFFGVVAFLNISPPLDGFWPHMAKTFVVATICGSLAGRLGDSAWRAILRFLTRPWR